MCVEQSVGVTNKAAKNNRSLFHGKCKCDMDKCIHMRKTNVPCRCKNNVDEIKNHNDQKNSPQISFGACARFFSLVFRSHGNHRPLSDKKINHGKKMYTTFNRQDTGSLYMIFVTLFLYFVWGNPVTWSNLMRCTSEWHSATLKPLFAVNVHRHGNNQRWQYFVNKIELSLKFEFCPHPLPMMLTVTKYVTLDLHTWIRIFVAHCKDGSVSMTRK